MRIVFMGTPDFAVPCLRALIDAKHDVVAVVTQPDKPVGRKQVLTPPPVKQCAVEYNIPVYQPERIKGSDTVDIIKEIAPDLIVVVAYGKILPGDVLNAAPYGCINVHASILPQYRGAAPIQWAVLNGDKETGVCIMQMDEGLDTGDILLCRRTNIDIDETSAELFDRLSIMGADALVDAIASIEQGTATPTPQPQAECQYATMISKDMSPINWNKSAYDIHNQVRGLQTWPVAVTTICGKNVKIHRTKLTDLDTTSHPGEVICNRKRLLVACGDGKAIEILSLQPEGKKRMDIIPYLAGNNIDIGTILGE